MFKYESVLEGFLRSFVIWIETLQTLNRRTRLW